MLESRSAVIDGLRVHYLASEAPQGPPLVLVHGLAVSSRYFVPLAEALAPDVHIVALDLPGYGRSAKPAHVLGIAELADFVVRCLDELGLERPALLGNSFGCQILVDLAARHPARAERLILIGPTMDPAAPTVLAQVRRWLRDSRREPPGLRGIVLSDAARAGPRRVLRTIRYALADRIEEKLPRVEVPALVVRGAEDTIVPQVWAERIVELLPRGELLVVPGAHAVNYSAPHELIERLRRFLTERDPAREA